MPVKTKAVRPSTVALTAIEGSQKGKKAIPPASEKVEIKLSTCTKGSERGRLLRKDTRETREKSTSPGSLFRISWPSLPHSFVPESPATDSLSIKPAQKPKTVNNPENQTPWRRKGKSPEDYEQGRVNKYVQYFQVNTILPIPEVTNQLETKMVLFLVTDLRLKRLAGLKKEVFGELPWHHNSWRSADDGCRWGIVYSQP